MTGGECVPGERTVVKSVADGVVEEDSEIKGVAAGGEYEAEGVAGGGTEDVTVVVVTGLCQVRSVRSSSEEQHGAR